MAYNAEIVSKLYSNKSDVAYFILTLTLRSFLSTFRQGLNQLVADAMSFLIG